MNLSKNLIVALMGLGCYARCNNINFANNTTILLIVLALLSKARLEENNGSNIETINTRTVNTVAYQGNPSTTTTRTVYNSPCAQNNFAYPYSFNQCPYTTTTYQTVMPYNYQSGCPCNPCSQNNFVY